LVCWWLMGAFSLRAATGLIGSVDSAFYDVRSAEVEVTDEANTSKRFTGRTDDEGIFRFPDLPPGQYSIKVTYGGFRDPAIHSASIQRGTLTDVGGIRLIAECEAQGGGCVSLGQWMPTSSGGGRIEMIDLCAVDLHEPEPWCSGAPGASGPIPLRGDLPQDFQFHVAKDGTWLVPLNGALFSLNPSTVTYKSGCPNATYAPGRIRIDSLPQGSRTCVRTHGGGYAELRFNEQIAPKQKTAAVDFVYRIN